MVSAAEAVASESPSETALAEITVTATRREQTVQDVPYNIESIGGAALAQFGVTTLNNLSQLVPGLQTVDTGPNVRGGNSQFSMRGLRTDGTGSELDVLPNNTVAPVSTYLGETPVFFPLALQDIARIEVLKGPQGTLYGSGSLAGTVRIIPNRPEVDRLSGSIDVQGSGTQQSDQPNASFNGMLNVPFGGNFAFRIAGGYERLAGFIDANDLAQRSGSSILSAPVPIVPTDTQSGYALAPIMRDTNWSEQWYVRPALRWKVSDLVEAELSYIHQRVGAGDAQYVNSNYRGGTFAFDDISGDPNAVMTFRPGGQLAHTADTLSPSDSKVDLGALTFTFNLGYATLTSSSSAYQKDYHQQAPIVPNYLVFNPDGSIYANYYDYMYNYPRANTQNVIDQSDRSFIQEVRLISTWDKPIDYVVGLYYQAERFNWSDFVYEPGYTDYLTSLNLAPPVLPRPAGDLTYYYPTNSNGFRFRDRAVFGELTWHITSKWQVTGGARIFRQDFHSLGHALDYLYTGEPTVDLDVDNRTVVNDHIFKINTSYDFTPDLKIYATFSEGFRRGGANPLPQSGVYASLPDLLNYKPDISRNYEIGVKGDMFDRSFRYTADVFLINLDNFQFDGIASNGFAGAFNGSQARSKGAELQAEYQLTRQLYLSASYAYTDAEVSKTFTLQDYAPGTLLATPNDPQIIDLFAIPKGAKLPGTPKNSANMAINYDFPVGSDASIRLHGDVAYRGKSPSYIDVTSARFWVIPASTQTNVRATYTRKEWSTDLFVNNLTNRTIYTGAYGQLQTVPSLFQDRYVVRPRTIGVGLHYHF